MRHTTPILVSLDYWISVSTGKECRDLVRTIMLCNAHLDFSKVTTHSHCRCRSARVPFRFAAVLPFASPTWRERSRRSVACDIAVGSQADPGPAGEDLSLYPYRAGPGQPVKLSDPRREGTAGHPPYLLLILTAAGG